MHVLRKWYYNHSGFNKLGKLNEFCLCNVHFVNCDYKNEEKSHSGLSESSPFYISCQV